MTTQVEILNELRDRRSEIVQNLSAILQQDLMPKIRDRVGALLNDLTNDDLSMALLDLAQLYRSLSAGDATVGQSASRGTRTPVRTFIYAADEAAIEDMCFGPNSDGNCPRVSAGLPVACADRWISALGWDFRVAPDAQLCPLTSLGIIRFLSRRQPPAERIDTS